MIMSENEKDKEQHELDKIRLRKMQMLMDQQKQQQDSQQRVISIGEKEYRGEQVFNWINNQLVFNFDEMLNLSGLS